MLRFILVLTFSLSSPIISAQAFKELKGEVSREVRGIWIASVYNLDWPSSLDQKEEEGSAEIIAILDKISSLGFNTLYLQVKPAWGVLYSSRLEPISRFLVSKGKELNWDPIATWIREARERGLFIHAWINPFRVLDNKNLYLKKSAWHKNLPQKNISWFDPSYREVTNHTLAILEEMLERYSFDGIHLDDYFYPYPAYLKGKEFDDSSEYKNYLKKGGTLELADWRRENVNRFIQNLSFWMRIHYPSKIFGISPFGIWKESQAYNIHGFEPYSGLYADSLKWINKGWIDYLAPQLYWSLDRPAQNFSHLLDWWTDHVKPNRQLLVGLQTRPIGSLFHPPEKEVVKLYAILKRKKKTQGVIFFRLQTLLKSPEAIKVFIKIFKDSAIPPPLPKKPKPPKPLIFIKNKTINLLNCRKTDRILLRYKKEKGMRQFISNCTSFFQLPIPLGLGENLEILYINESGNLGPAFRLKNL